MKNLLLLVTLFLMGTALAAKDVTLALEVFSTDAVIEDKGDAVRTRDVLNSKGVKKGCTLYYRLNGSEFQTVKVKVASKSTVFSMRASQGGVFECKSFSVNGQEQLNAPITILRSKQKKQEKFKVESESGKMDVVLQVRRVE